MSNNANPGQAAGDAVIPATSAVEPPVTGGESSEPIEKQPAVRDGSGRFAPKSGETTTAPEASGETDNSGDDDATSGDDPQKDGAIADGTVLEGAEDVEPDGTDPEAWQAWRVRESNRIAVAKQEAEDLAALGLSPVPVAQKPAEGESAPAAGTVAETPAPITARFANLVTELTNDRENFQWEDGTAGYVPGPGETKLVTFIEKDLLPTIQRQQETLDAVNSFFLAQQARTINSAAEAAAVQFKETWGVEITPRALMGMVQNGGAEAWTKLKGIPFDEFVLHLTPTAFVEIAQAKMGSKLQAPKQAAPTKEVTPKAKLPNVAAGGATATSKPAGELTPQEISRQARLEARAAKGVA